MVALDLIDMSAVVAELAEVSFLTVTSDIELFAVPVDAESASIESSFESNQDDQDVEETVACCENLDEYKKGFFGCLMNCMCQCFG